MKKKIIRGTMILIGVAFTACNGSDLFGPVNESRLSFEVDGNNCFVSADDFDNFREFARGNFRSKTFVWECTDFKGQDEVFVSLTFDNSNDGTDCLRLSEEFVADGLCF